MTPTLEATLPGVTTLFAGPQFDPPRQPAVRLLVLATGGAAASPARELLPRLAHTLLQLPKDLMELTTLALPPRGQEVGERVVHEISRAHAVLIVVGQHELALPSAVRRILQSHAHVWSQKVVGIIAFTDDAEMVSPTGDVVAALIRERGLMTLYFPIEHGDSARSLGTKGGKFLSNMASIARTLRQEWSPALSADR